MRTHTFEADCGFVSFICFASSASNILAGTSLGRVQFKNCEPRLTCCFTTGVVPYFLLETKREHMKPRADIQQGTLALMVLKTLDALGPLHGYGIARRIEQISGDLLSVNHGTLYPVLLKLQEEES